MITVAAVASLGIFRLTAVKRIPANTVGVKVSAIGGVQENTLQTGYHLKMPFIDKVYTLSTSVQTKTMEKITTQTKDGQWLNTNIDVKYRVNKEKAMTVFSNYTDLENVNNSVVSPAVQRAIESVTGNYDIYDILGNKRTEVYEMIDKALKEKFESYDLEFVSFTITDQDAGDEIEAAIKNESVKQKEIDTAKQEQEKAKVEADTKKVQAQADADAGIIKAEGEAKANKAKSDSITDNLIRMKEAEAREKHGWVTVNGAGSVITNKE
ncbi:B-cell receptor associated protein-related protein [Streptococcus mitis]|uniref:B-cell receptor associated protein-related protein n=1 Tax=Streptococcus mitis TaxID=28037 RepID=A0A1T0C3I1_STRMT|nr:B-cell receptor associated protein-related protein [Streptococcus mitis]